MLNDNDWWFRSGMAQEAARELAWFVVIVVVAIGIGMWRTHKREEKETKHRKRGE